MENVRCGGVIQDDGVAYWTAKLRQVLECQVSTTELKQDGDPKYLDIVAFVIVTTFSE